MSNYEIIKDEKVLNEFIKWLPDLEEGETFYLTLFSRKKYFPSLQSDKSQLKRVTSKKEDIIDKLHQMECKIGSYKMNNIIIPQESLVVYITPNPRSFINATKNSLKRFSDLITQNYSGYNPQQEVLTEIQKSCSRKIYFDLDFDKVDLKYIKDNVLKYLNKECVNILKTKGGFHVLIELKKIEEQCVKSWYKNITSLNRLDVRGDNLIPIPGCVQSDFVPHFEMI